MSDSTYVRRAELTDAVALTEIMAAAFRDDPVSAWAFPNPATRDNLHRDFFRVFVDDAIKDGGAWTTSDLAGAALWFEVDPARPETPEETERMYASMLALLGPESGSRFRTLTELMGRQHPHHAAHQHLAFIAVRPGQQGRGVGGALLQHRLAALDEAGTPGFLEASSPRSMALYERMGFVRQHPDIQVPDGPTMFPMWRPHRG